MNGTEILMMREYLVANSLQYDDEIHIKVAERKEGKQFSFEEHIAALVYAQLTNQTTWSRIVPNLDKIDELFFYYDPYEIKKHPGSYFAEGIFSLKCGNRSTRAQMNYIHENIATMEMIVNDYGSMDTFVLSNSPLQIVELLAFTKSKYKMKMLGKALAWEYIRNVGIDACKPDTHLRRFLGNERMGIASGMIATVDEVISQIEQLSKETGLMLSSIDNVIWSYCAEGYGEICTATPHCDRCVIQPNCKFNPCVSECVIDDKIPYEWLRKVSIDCDLDPTKIGKYILSKLEL